jgi:hypothetical protein
MLFRWIKTFSNYRPMNSLLQGFPEQGIKLFSGFLHTHLAGTQVRVRHFRDGIELPMIMEDIHYDFNFQVELQCAVLALYLRVSISIFPISRFLIQQDFPFLQNLSYF